MWGDYNPFVFRFAKATSPYTGEAFGQNSFTSSIKWKSNYKNGLCVGRFCSQFDKLEK